MTLSTTKLRVAWAPACTGPFTIVNLYGDGRISIRSTTVDAWHALDACLIAHNYRTRRADTGAYNCRKITGGTGYSLHAYGIAADLNWQTNPYGKRLVTDMPRAMVDAILAIRTNNGQQVFRWGGDYSTNKDAMHYEIVCTPADIASGINRASLPDSKPVPAPYPTPTPQPPKGPLMALTDAQQTELLTKVRDLHADYAVKGKGVRQVIAEIAQRTKDLATGARPGKAAE